MSKKQKTSRNTANHISRSGTDYRKCPKCGDNTLVINNRTKGGKTRWVCRETRGDRRHCYTTTNPDAPYRDQKGDPREIDKNPQFRRKLSDIKRFIITTAQNATPTHMDFFESLERYAKYNDAELVVIPVRYKNPTSR